VDNTPVELAALEGRTQLLTTVPGRVRHQDLRSLLVPRHHRFEYQTPPEAVLNHQVVAVRHSSRLAEDVVGLVRVIAVVAGQGAFPAVEMVMAAAAHWLSGPPVTAAVQVVAGLGRYCTLQKFHSTVVQVGEACQDSEVGVWRAVLQVKAAHRETDQIGSQRQNKKRAELVLSEP